MPKTTWTFHGTARAPSLAPSAPTTMKRSADKKKKKDASQRRLDEVMRRIHEQEQRRRDDEERRRAEGERRSQAQQRIGIEEFAREHAGYMTMVAASERSRVESGTQRARAEMRRYMMQQDLRDGVRRQWPTLTHGAVQYLAAIEDNRRRHASTLIDRRERLERERKVAVATAQKPPKKDQPSVAESLNKEKEEDVGQLIVDKKPCGDNDVK